MDEKTLHALTTLAQKLGTTAEYLWGVLLRQAPITGVVDLLIAVAWVIAVSLWFRFVMRKTNASNKTESNQNPRAEWRDEAAGFAWFSAIIFAVIASLAVTFSLPSIVSALLNHEYWALRQILK